MPLSPYISFAGHCADAIAYYHKTLGAELLYKITFGEMPPPEQGSEDGCPSGVQFPDTSIAHANVRIAGSDIMMSDAVASGNASYSGFTLVLDTQDVAEGKRWFDNLAAQGQIEMDWQETFWAHGFGKVTDQYGVPWMINVVKQPQPTE
ncbi:TPA: VOC family metalloprotein YjdN [Citrobacter koseri]|uniref:VOC family metalloprotein YjdN n=1 Tax=Citrobacter koseri TaxID=545 RepID=UPI001A1A0179|nr:VOC family metalloprotein YjdN [Citrobacter koseri]HBC9088109.1 VOC family metalloprotein YjdN [Citrobacter koseri]HDQ2604733.1 VOC family metalloprotein YjdN [Citrobacter koseri]HEM6801362.1 VOC family metalloprotein YjdN [Citrobacter koseri]